MNASKIAGGLFIFALGAIAGGTGMYYYLKKNNKIEYEIIKPATDEKESPKEEVEVETADEPQNDFHEGDIMDFYNEAVNNVDSHYIDYTAIEDGEPKIVRPKVEDVPETRDCIYEISEEDFIEGEPGYDKDTFAYYEGDGSLVDETGGMSELVDDVKNTISDELFDQFVHDPDVDVMYVRNEMYGTLFEVYKRMENYGELVGFEQK